MNLQIDISIVAGEWPAREQLEKLVRKAFAATAKRGRFAVPKPAELSLLFTNDAQIQQLNQQWRGVDKPTNVLSFAGSGNGTGQAASAMLGDIVLAQETITAEALLEGKKFEDHLTHLVVHGLLHLFGYDHVDKAGAQAMEEIEQRSLAMLGIADPYVS